MASFRNRTKISNLSDDSCQLSNPEFGMEVSPENAAGDFRLIQDTDTTDQEDVKLLKEKLKEFEILYKDLLFENEQTLIDLNHEKHKVTQLERKLKFAKDNQTIFEKIQEACVSSKCNKATGRKLVEIRDKSVQTWDGVLCRACLDTEKLRRNMELIQAKYKDCIIVKREEIDKINATVQTLKGFVGDKEDDDGLKSFEIHGCMPQMDGLDLNNKEGGFKFKYRKNLWRSHSVDRGLTRKVKADRLRKGKCHVSRSLAQLKNVT